MCASRSICLVMLRRASFLIKLPQAANLLKMRFWHRCFPANFAKFFRTPFCIEHLRSLLLRVTDVELKINAFLKCAPKV